MFPHKTVEITIQHADETDYILSDPEYTQDLMERIEEYEAKKKTISIKADELSETVQARRIKQGKKS